MTMVELKAAAYDVLAQMERLKMQLEAINNEIAKENEKELRRQQEERDSLKTGSDGSF